jgi:ketosteroid isomerase-like protein
VALVNGDPLREEHIMTTTATTSTDVDAVRAGFEAVAAGDLAAFAAAFHPDATWNHRNDDRLGGIKDGVEAIVGFLVESMELTAGTLRPVPEIYLPDGDGRVAVLTQITGTRPDGRSFDDTQILLFRLEEGRVRSVDQFVGDPTAVVAFWA